MLGSSATEAVIKATIYVLCVTMSFGRTAAQRNATLDSEHASATKQAQEPYPTVQAVPSTDSDDFIATTPTLGRALCCTPCLDNMLFDLPFSNVPAVVAPTKTRKSSGDVATNTTKPAQMTTTKRAKRFSFSSASSDKREIFIGNAFDIIFLQRGNSFFQNSEFQVSFGKQLKPHHKVLLEIRGEVGSQTDVPHACTTKAASADSDMQRDATSNAGTDASDSGETTDSQPLDATTRPVAWFPVNGLYQSLSNGRRHIRSIHEDGDEDEGHYASDAHGEDLNQTSALNNHYWGCCRPLHSNPDTTTSSTPQTSGSSDVLSRQLHDNTVGSSEGERNHQNHRNNQRNSNTNDDDADCNQGDTVARQLKPFLQPGKNPIRYLLLDERQVIGVAYANIFVWSNDTRIVLADIDGTITKSNVRGIMDTILTEKYRHCHDGICDFLSNLDKLPNTQVVYLTSRPIVLATKTRKFLKDVRQDVAALPDGPLFGFGGSLPRLLAMELLFKTVQRFKFQTIWDQLVKPFLMANSAHGNGNYQPSDVFLAAFGNSWTDIQAYHKLGIDFDKIYFIDKKSEVRCFDGHGNGGVGGGARRQNSTATTVDMLESATDDSTKLRDADGVDAGMHITEKIESMTAEMTTRQYMSVDWYKKRMGSTYRGYSDEVLHSRFLATEEVTVKTKVDVIV